MSDKILYTGGPNPFKGLIGMPEPPTSMRYTQAWLDYNKQVESIKSNAPDIVNYKDILGIVSDMQGGLWHSGGDQLKPGDIFDLPVGYEFKKGVQGTILKDGGCETRVVLRIVKTEVMEENVFEKEVKEVWHKSSLFSQPEPEESQKELLDAFLNKLYEYTKETKSAGLSPEDSKESVFEVLSTEFTIQRKK